MPDIILMLLLLTEVLVPINNFCKFLQTRNFYYSLVMAKYQQVASKLESIKTELPNHSSVDTSLKYFKFANIFSEYLHYSQEEAMSLSRELQSWDTLTDHYGQPITDRYENHTTTTIHVINTPQQI